MAKKKDRKFNYFDAFEKQTHLACEEARLLVKVIEEYKGPEALSAQVDLSHEIERAGDKVCHDVFEAVSSDFVTPFDREDIIDMTRSLDDVLDYMEGTIQRFYMLNVSSMHPDALEFAKMLQKSCEALEAAMGDFRNFKNSKKLKKLVIAINDTEEEADELFFRVMHSLYTDGANNPVDVFTWDKIFQRLEDTADACEAVADTMGSILMKNG